MSDTPQYNISPNLDMRTNHSAEPINGGPHWSMKGPDHWKSGSSPVGSFKPTTDV